jgi:nitrate/TMAO reductase-like tetraheme cytochrome c subunit
MAKTKSVLWRRAGWLLISIIGLLVLAGLILPVGINAGPPAPTGAETCAKCHGEETDAWQDSPHAHAVDETNGALGATCEDCHGVYVEDHPEAGVMQLTVDSSICKDCHASTFEQWEDSIHAKNRVQCIGCHLSHSQEFRVSDDRLCAACHRERLDTAHGQSGVSCIDCHLSPTNAHEVALVSTNAEQVEIPGSTHDFTSVLSKDCVSCHGNEVHRDQTGQVSNVWSADDAPACEPELIAKLENVEQTNKSLMTITPLSLGLGMGVGGMLGIIFMLALGYISQGMKK